MNDTKENKFWFFRTRRDLVAKGWLAILSNSEKDVYLVLLFHLNVRTGLCCPSLKTIQKYIHKSKTTISKAVNNLRKYELISIERRGRKYFYELPQQLPSPPGNRSIRLDHSRERDKKGHFKSSVSEKLSFNGPAGWTQNDPAARTQTRSSLNEKENNKKSIRKTPPSAPQNGGNGPDSAKAVAGPSYPYKLYRISKETAEEVAKIKGQGYVEERIKVGPFKINLDSENSEETI